MNKIYWDPDSNGSDFMTTLSDGIHIHMYEVPSSTTSCRNSNCEYNVLLKFMQNIQIENTCKGSVSPRRLAVFIMIADVQRLFSICHGNKGPDQTNGVTEYRQSRVSRY